MIKDLENKEVDLESFFGVDSTTVVMAPLLLSKIAEAKSNNHYGESVVSNYNTYNFSFKDNLMTVSGLVKEDVIFKFKLSEFIEELERLSNPSCNPKHE
jgi:hypothetical protein